MSRIEESQICTLAEALKGAGLKDLALDPHDAEAEVSRDPLYVPINPNGSFYCSCGDPVLFSFGRVGRGHKDGGRKPYPLNSSYNVVIAKDEHGGPRLRVNVSC
jgi:hypothetical protein